MPPYLIFAILSLVFFTISTIAFKLTAKYSLPNHLAWFFWYFVIYFLLGRFVPFFVSIRNPIPQNIFLLRYNFLYGFFIYLGIFFFSYSLYHLDVSVISPLSNFTTVFILILAYFFLGEKIILNKIIWFLLIIIGGFIASYNEKLKGKSFLNKYVFSFIFWTFCLATTRIVINKATKVLDYWQFVYYQFTYSIIFLILIYPFIRKKIKTSLKSIFYLSIPIIFEFFGVLTTIKAFSYQVSIPAVVSSFPLLFIIVFIISRINKKFGNT